MVPTVRGTTSPQGYSPPGLKGLFLGGSVGRNTPSLLPASRPYIHLRFRARSGGSASLSQALVSPVLSWGKGQVGVGEAAI